MSCALTSGYALNCRNNVAGISEIRLASFVASATFATNASSQITGAVTGYASNSFYLFELPKGVGQFTETVVQSVENQSNFYQQELTLVVNRLSQDVRNELQKVCNQRLVAIVTDRNGVYWVLGSGNGLEVTAGTAQTGAAFADRNGYELTLTGLEQSPCRQWVFTSPTIGFYTSGAQITGGS